LSYFKKLTGEDLSRYLNKNWISKKAYC